MLQISTLENDYVIDSLTLHGAIARHLGPIFESRRVVKVMHGCDTDLPLLVVRSSSA